ncbi:glutamine amidotransferase [uncultured Bartonella sp.]|uniref:glutamine amidotransferase n=1 Tax=uncultured Bartonella sp. TaxID=104108 RepID=UPI00262777F3|nr:glutamine amidotransferase [uncultured Bartonella sp.]
MNQSPAFEPLLSWPISITLVGVALVFIISAICLRKLGGWLRLVTLAALAIALFNPVIIEEQREPVKSVVGVVVDRSQSQNFGTRTKDSDEALKLLKDELAKHPQFEPRFIEAKTASDINNGPETRLFTPLNEAIADVPPALYAGTILITDGEVHDINEARGNTAGEKPVNALITGEADEFDRQVKFIDAPRFAITNKPVLLSFVVEDKGKIPATTGMASVTVKINGKIVQTREVTPNSPLTGEFVLPHAGKNIVEVSTEPLEGELTDVNNTAVTIIDGVRENLRVLLVSGEPHNGERTWRDLLKSDPSIDLVHFTILRPPEKADNTPLSQLSLIVFPTTELFVDKINDFDLVIFDRYQHYDVLPLIYYDYVAQYVKNGGALLMATGPEFSGNTSLARTPLLSVLPALPSGEIIEKPYLPTLTPAGDRHPVTRGLKQENTKDHEWGRWLRQIAVQDTSKSTVVMNGADNRPLMLLAHIGDGRVGMLLSDEGWLWARGFEGGGPYAALYRRMAHWLMKEPELEEEALTATGEGNRLTVRRQTMADKPDVAIVHFPSGKTQTLALTKEQEGVFSASLETDEIGLFKVTNGDKEALSHIGPTNSPEYADLISTDEKLLPVAKSTGGGVIRLHQKPGDKVKVPAIEIVNGKNNQTIAKPNRIVLNSASQTRLVNTFSFPLFNGVFALVALLLLLSSVWYRESR